MNNDFGFLGYDYQKKLILQILTDIEFAKSIVDTLSPNYFDNEYLKIIVSKINEAYEDFEIIPNVESLEIRLKSAIKDKKTLKILLDTLGEVKKSSLNDSIQTQDEAIVFCKQQELKKVNKIIENIVENKTISRFDECVELVKSAVEIGKKKTESVKILDNIESVLTQESRDPIPTGLEALDNLFRGGVAKGELVMFLAPTGIGKTTFLTKVANAAYNDNRKVLQIIFEDRPDAIQKKHYACWTGLPIEDQTLPENKPFVIEKVKEATDGKLNNLHIERMKNGRTSIKDIKKLIRTLIADGFVPDVIFLDYIDCLIPSRRYDKSHEGEGEIIREFEDLVYEYNVAGWVATQGNRESMGKDLVETNTMGGSIKKAQATHVLISVGKTETQKLDKRATLSILKSRIGGDGKVFEDIIFDNEKMIIDTSNATSLNFQERKEKKKLDTNNLIKNYFKNKEETTN